MAQPAVFTPNGEVATPFKIQRIYIFLIVVFSIPMLFSHTSLTAHLIIQTVILSLYLVLMFRHREPIDVTISEADGTLTCKTIDFRGRVQNVVVELSTATISYKLGWTRKSNSGLRLKLYNSYWSNKITLYEGSAMGNFSKDDLDTIVSLIERVCSNKLHARLSSLA